MKLNLKYLYAAILVITCACNEQETKDSPIPVKAVDTIHAIESAKTEHIPIDKVAAIRAEVQRINNMNVLVKSFSWSEDGCVEGGKVNYYLNNDSIVKVTESGFIGDGGWVKEYYYSKGKFIFSFMQHIGGPAAMPVDTSEIRIYADNDTLVLKKRNNDYMDDLSQKFNSRSVEYKILAAYKDKNFAKVFCN